MKKTPLSSTVFDGIIIGAGASGLFCALTAARRGKKVLLIDHKKDFAKKILISGGGKCNFTNQQVEASNYRSQNSHFVKSALAQFAPEDFLSFLKKHHIPWFEKTDGQLFTKSSAQAIRKMLIDECTEAGVTICAHTQVVTWSNEKHWTIQTTKGIYDSKNLVIATGGLSYPSTGATNFGYEFAKKLGIKRVPCVPALVPLLWNPQEQKKYTSLAGISLPVKISCRGFHKRDAFLFTHTGLSGPAILNISLVWNENDPLKINLLPDLSFSDLFDTWKVQHPKTLLATLLSRIFPKRFIQVWAPPSVVQKPISQISNQQRDYLATLLHDWDVRPDRTAGFNVAEVTRGGIDTSAISSKTMAVKKIRGLYFIGELIDVTGEIGGYNLHWAWASAHAAASSL